MTRTRSSHKPALQKEIAYYVDQWTHYKWDEYGYSDNAEIGEEAGWGSCTREGESPDRGDWKMGWDQLRYFISHIRSYNRHRREIHQRISSVRQESDRFSVRLGDYFRNIAL